MAKADSVHSTPPTNTPIDTERRRFLAVAAGASVVSVGTLAVAAAIPTAVLAAAPAVDPVFDLIDIHRKAHAAHLAAIKEADRLEGMHGGSWSDITEQPCNDENDAFEALLAAAATTLPGLLAKLDYIRDLAEQQAWMLDEREGAAISLSESFAASIKNIWQVQS
jgi:hypothetical protein